MNTIYQKRFGQIGTCFLTVFEMREPEENKIHMFIESIQLTKPDP